MSRQTDFAEIKSLKEKVRSWRRVVERLQGEVNTLEAENKRLREDNKALETKVANVQKLLDGVGIATFDDFQQALKE